MKNKKGTSLTELIAVIVIMGVIAAVAVPSTISVINRQKRKTVINTQNEIYASAQILLNACIAQSNEDEDVVFSKNGFYYTSQSIMIATGNLDAKGYTITDKEIYYLYNDSSDIRYAVFIGDDVPDAMPSTSSETTTMRDQTIFWNIETNSFEIA